MSEIFISWSKERSLHFANALRELMVRVLHEHGSTPSPPAKPGDHLVTLSEDLPKGGGWFSNLAGLLENARAGIICATPENLSSPWLLFEAGALIRCDVQVALFPVLLDVPPSLVEGPLSLVQGTVIQRDRTAIVREIHALLERVAQHVSDIRDPQPIVYVDPPSAATDSNQSSPWDTFVDKVLEIPPASIDAIVERFPQLFERKTFQESFQDCADQRWLERYAGARLAHDELERHKSRVAAALPPGAQLAYERLSSAVDSYAMSIAGQLLDERKFNRDADGCLVDTEGRLGLSERRRQRIQATYLRLRDPIPPIFDDARVYEELDGLEERKRRLIHPLEHRLDTGLAEGNTDGLAKDWQLKRAAVSPWLYDRLVFYVHAARIAQSASAQDVLDALERELGLLESREEPGTLVGIYYALEAVERRRLAQSNRTMLADLLDRIVAQIDKWNRVAQPSAPARDRVDANGKVRRIVARLRT